MNYSLKEIVEKSNKENLKIIKNTLPNKSRNPESLKKQLWQLESSSTNVHIVCEDLLRVFYKLFCLRSCDSSDQWKTLVAKILQGAWEKFLYENNHTHNSYKVSFILLLFSFRPFAETKNKDQNFQQDGNPVTRNIYIFCL